MEKQNYSLRMSIISAFAFLFMVLVGIIIAFNYYSGHKMAMQTAEDVFKQAGETAIHKTVDFLKPAIHSAKMFERVISKKHLDPKDITQIHDYCLQVLRVYTQFNACFYANEYGLWGAEYGKGEIIDLATRYRNKLTERQAIVKDTWIDKNDKIVREKESMSDYDPRIRPWYINVKKLGAPYWTEPYLFFNEQIQIGVSATVPIFNEENLFAGATLIDITMDALAKFLKDLKVSEHSLAFIIDGHGKLVCFPDMDVAIESKGEDKRLRNIIELKNFKHLISAYAEHSKSDQDRIIVEGKEGREIVQFISFPESFGKDWKMVITAQERDFTEELRKSNEFSILVSLFILLTSTLLISVIAKNISKPIIALTDQLDRISDMELDTVCNVESRIYEIAQISQSIEGLRSALQAFKKYVPAGLVKDLIATGETARIGGKNELLTVFFSDIKDFTTISEGLPPEYLGLHLSEYLDELSKIIIECGGTIDKYIGDAIMGFWGAPHKDLNHERNACKAALLCQKKVGRVID